MSERKDKCPRWQGEECWYDEELERYVVVGWDCNETCPTCHGTGKKDVKTNKGGANA